MARCVLLDAKLGHRYWAEAANAAVKIRRKDTLRLQQLALSFWNHSHRASFDRETEEAGFEGTESDIR